MAKKKRPTRRKAATNIRGHKVAKTWVNRQRWSIVEAPLPQTLPLLMPGEGWYVARVNVRCEDKVERALSVAGVAVFVPRFVRKATRQKQVRETKPAVCPGYVFVGFDGKAIGDALVRSLEGVDTLLSYWDPCQYEMRPLRVPDAVMARFVAEVSENAKPMMLGDLLKVADTVRFEDGAFAGRLGQVLQIAGGKADVLTDVLGGKRVVKVPVDSLAAA